MTIPRFLEPANVPDGQYEGVWSGHELQYVVGGRDVYVETRRGVRGMNIPVTLDVKGSRVVESTIKPIRTNEGQP